MEIPEQLTEPTEDVMERATIYYDPLGGPESVVYRAAIEVPKFRLDDIDFEEAVFVKIGLPRTLYTGQGEADCNHGRLVEIFDGEFSGRKAIYLEKVGNKHKVLVLKNSRVRGLRVDTTVNLKEIWIRVKDDTGRFVRVEDLPAYNRNAADIVAGLDWDRPDALEAGMVPHGLRVVDARHAVVVHAGWRGVAGLIEEQRERPYPKVMDDAMKVLAMAMARLGVPFLSHGMKRDIERYAARFVPQVARRYGAEYNAQDD